MSAEKSIDDAAFKVGAGVAAGVATGLCNAQALQVHAPKLHPALLNASSNYANGAIKALKNHKGLTGAAAAGAAAVAHTALGAAVVTVGAPVVAVGASLWGAYKLTKYLASKL